MVKWLQSKLIVALIATVSGMLCFCYQDLNASQTILDAMLVKQQEIKCTVVHMTFMLIAKWLQSKLIFCPYSYCEWDAAFLLLSFNASEKSLKAILDK